MGIVAHERDGRRGRETVGHSKSSHSYVCSLSWTIIPTSEPATARSRTSNVEPKTGVQFFRSRSATSQPDCGLISTEISRPGDASPALRASARRST
jgi:hypothetical protein